MPFNRAPADIARSAAESAAPWAWRHAVGIWNFSLGISGFVPDLSGNGNHAELGSAVGKATTAFGLSPLFTDSDTSSFARVSNPKNIPQGQAGEELGVFALVRADQTTGSGGDNGGIVKYEDGNDGWTCRLEEINSTPNKPRILTAGGNSGDTSYTVTLGEFASLFFSWKGGSFYRLHADGERLFQTSTTDTSSVASDEDLFMAVEGFGTGGHNSENSGLTGAMPVFILRDRVWEDWQAEELSHDPFAPFRRRPILVPVSSGGAQTVTVGQATETDTAFAVSAAKAQSIGQATETDIAQSVTAIRTHAVGQATETDTAQPVGASKAKAIGQATETDTAFPVTAIRTYSIGQATETDTANSITHSKSVTVGQAQETDEAFPVTATGGATALGLIPRNRLFMKNVDKLMDY